MATWTNTNKTFVTCFIMATLFTWEVFFKWPSNNDLPSLIKLNICLLMSFKYNLYLYGILLECMELYGTIWFNMVTNLVLEILSKENIIKLHLFQFRPSKLNETCAQTWHEASSYAIQYHSSVLSQRPTVFSRRDLIMSDHRAWDSCLLNLLNSWNIK